MCDRYSSEQMSGMSRSVRALDDDRKCKVETEEQSDSRSQEMAKDIQNYASNSKTFTDMPNCYVSEKPDEHDDFKSWQNTKYLVFYKAPRNQSVRDSSLFRKRPRNSTEIARVKPEYKRDIEKNKSNFETLQIAKGKPGDCLNALSANKRDGHISDLSRNLEKKGNQTKEAVRYVKIEQEDDWQHEESQSAYLKNGSDEINEGQEYVKGQDKASEKPSTDKKGEMFPVQEQECGYNELPSFDCGSRSRSRYKMEETCFTKCKSNEFARPLSRRQDKGSYEHIKGTSASNPSKGKGKLNVMKKDGRKDEVKNIVSTPKRSTEIKGNCVFPVPPIFEKSGKASRYASKSSFSKRKRKASVLGLDDRKDKVQKRIPKSQSTIKTKANETFQAQTEDHNRRVTETRERTVANKIMKQKNYMKDNNKKKQRLMLLLVSAFLFIPNTSNNEGCIDSASKSETRNEGMSLEIQREQTDIPNESIPRLASFKPFEEKLQTRGTMQSDSNNSIRITTRKSKKESKVNFASLNSGQPGKMVKVNKTEGRILNEKHKLTLAALRQKCRDNIEAKKKLGKIRKLRPNGTPSKRVTRQRNLAEKKVIGNVKLSICGNAEARDETTLTGIQRENPNDSVSRIPRLDLLGIDENEIQELQRTVISNATPLIEMPREISNDSALRIPCLNLFQSEEKFSQDDLSKKVPNAGCKVRNKRKKTFSPTPEVSTRAGASTVTSSFVNEKKDNRRKKFAEQKKEHFSNLNQTANDAEFTNISSFDKGYQNPVEVSTFSDIRLTEREIEGTYDINTAQGSSGQVCSSVESDLTHLFELNCEHSAELEGSETIQTERTPILNESDETESNEVPTTFILTEQHVYPSSRECFTSSLGEGTEGRENDTAAGENDNCLDLVDPDASYDGPGG